VIEKPLVFWIEGRFLPEIGRTGDLFWPFGG
jgi:hypothetical protein